MKKPKPGYYWARIRDYVYPTVVEFCDESGDEWFSIMNVDAAIDLAEADEFMELLNPIEQPSFETSLEEEKGN